MISDKYLLSKKQNGDINRFDPPSEKKKLCSLTSGKDKHIQSVAFSMNDTAVVITEEGGVASLFDAKDGSPLAQHISAASMYY